MFDEDLNHHAGLPMLVQQPHAIATPRPPELLAKILASSARQRDRLRSSTPTSGSRPCPANPAVVGYPVIHVAPAAIPHWMCFLVCDQTSCGPRIKAPGEGLRNGVMSLPIRGRRSSGAQSDRGARFRPGCVSRRDLKPHRQPSTMNDGRGPTRGEPCPDHGNARRMLPEASR